jgi:ABC-type antimicrobial peptide transport system ATPase subunit
MSEQTIVRMRDLCKTFPVKHARGALDLAGAERPRFRNPAPQDPWPDRRGGPGKTAIGRSFVGLIPSTTGTVTLFDHDIPSTTGQAGLAALRARLQFVFQDLTPRFNPRVWIGWDC